MDLQLQIQYQHLLRVYQDYDLVCLWIIGDTAGNAVYLPPIRGNHLLQTHIFQDKLAGQGCPESGLLQKGAFLATFD